LGRRSALVLARAPALRDSLVVLFRALPQLGQIRQAETLSEALARTSLPAPDLVLYDLEPAREDVWAALTRIKARWPRSHCLVLVEDERAAAEARAAGADVVLTKGILAARLLDTLKGLVGAED
jgi:DNA-binding NarL/FixJ family response regulator